MNKSELIQAFNKVAIHNRMDPFFEADIDLFFDSDAQFSLNLKRSDTAVALYGKCHVELRQAFFNDCSKEHRVRLFKSKIKAANLDEWIKKSLQCTLDDIQDVIDVGKGRSVYKFTLDHDQFYILKEKVNNFQEVFHAIAGHFKFPMSNSWFYHEKDIHWELTVYIEPQHIFEVKQEALINIFAKAAVIGDMFCIGDRHFDNYICQKDNTMIPIDVAHMLDVDHDLWTEKYIAGGLYECCILQQYVSNLHQFQKHMMAFFTFYYSESVNLFEQLSQKKFDTIEGLGVQQVLEVKNKWKTLPYYFNHMQSIYIDALQKMIDRLIYKQLLEQLSKTTVDFNDYPELKMYALADNEQPSIFFLLEDIDVDIFDQIKHLSVVHLGVTNQYFSDAKLSFQLINDFIKTFKFDQVKLLVQ